MRMEGSGVGYTRILKPLTWSPRLGIMPPSPATTGWRSKGPHQGNRLPANIKSVPFWVFKPRQLECQIPWCKRHKSGFQVMWYPLTRFRPRPDTASNRSIRGFIFYPPAPTPTGRRSKVPRQGNHLPYDIKLAYLLGIQAIVGIVSRSLVQALYVWCVML